MLFAVLIASGFFSCGVERQDVKVLRDPGAARLTAPQQVTVEQLVGARRPYGSRGRARIERIVVAVDAVVIGVKDESDGDLHVSLAGQSGATVIAEFPSPACTSGSAYAAQMQKARENFLRLASVFGRRRVGPLRLRFTGVVFFDRVHGQSNAAINGIELHPLLAVEPLGEKRQPRAPRPDADEGNEDETPRRGD